MIHLVASKQKFAQKSEGGRRPFSTAQARWLEFLHQTWVGNPLL